MNNWDLASRLDLSAEEMQRLIDRNHDNLAKAEGTQLQLSKPQVLYLALRANTARAGEKLAELVHRTMLRDPEYADRLLKELCGDDIQAFVRR